MAFGSSFFITGHSAFQTINSSSFQTLNNTAQAEPTLSTNPTTEATEQQTQAEGETTSIAFTPADKQTIAAFMRDAAANRSQTQNVTIVAGMVTKKLQKGKEEEAKKKEKKRVMRMSDVIDPNTPASCGGGRGRCRC